MKFREYLSLGFLFVSLLLCGCSTAVLVGVGAGAGVGTYSYLRGELTMDYPYAYDRTWNASLTALDRLEIEVTSRQRDALGGKITAQRSDGKPVVLKIRDKGLGVTTVGIRVGSFGDREASRKIHETIVSGLRG
jgi:hypothetical protein